LNDELRFYREASGDIQGAETDKCDRAAGGEVQIAKDGGRTGDDDAGHRLRRWNSRRPGWRSDARRKDNRIRKRSSRSRRSRRCRRCTSISRSAT